MNHGAMNRSEAEVVGEHDEHGRGEKRSFELPREPMPTLPDGIPSSLWEEAVESERRSKLPPLEG